MDIFIILIISCQMMYQYKKYLQMNLIKYNLSKQKIKLIIKILNMVLYILCISANLKDKIFIN